MFVYDILKRTIWWMDKDGVRVVAEDVYSGDHEHQNQPASMDEKQHGPIPVGVYRIGHPQDTPDHGQYFIPLEPIPGNDMLGRGGFGIHGERKKGDPGFASKGCLITGPDNRREIGAKTGTLLSVVYGLWP